MASKLVYADAVTNYVGGVVTRERERLAAIFAANGMSEIAEAIKDRSEDTEIFAWKGRKVVDWDDASPQSSSGDSEPSSGH